MGFAFVLLVIASILSLTTPALGEDAAYPEFKLKFVAHLFPDVLNPLFIKVPEGLRTNIAVHSGNWTSPTGELIATVVPHVGAEHGYTGTDGIYRQDVRYNMQFVSDGSYAYVEFQGFGDLGFNNRVFATIETDSEDHLDYRGKVYYGQGIFYGDYLYMPHYEAV